ncbi:MAG: DUF4037 domain-containing protein [Clostridium sp.]|nr:DUF4037 domain-containing protein [Clostridium sp.]
MDLKRVLEGLDTLFEEHRLEEVDGYLSKQLAQAFLENDFEAEVSILNEMLGFARETSRYDLCEVYGVQVLQLMENSPYKDTISHATTLLNVANAKRAAGKLEESFADYEKVEQIYHEQLPERDYQFASLYNNKGLLYEEMQEYEKAANAFEQAIGIVSAYEGNEYYQAVSYANLANATVMLKAYHQAQEYAKKAVALFETLAVKDSHKGAALAALGEICQAKGNTEEAISYYEQAKECILGHIGKNAAYYRVQERLDYLKQNGRKEEERKRSAGQADAKVMDSSKKISGARLCREYYEQYGIRMITDQFKDYESKIAVGHVGEGSDCFGFDDDISTDHDFGPGFSMWVSKDTYDKIGKDLQQAYMALPDEFMGYKRVHSRHGGERFGVCIIEDFYERVLSGGHLPQKDTDYLNLEDCYLAASINGEVYRDDEGVFTDIRNQLKAGYPEGVKLLKLAQKAALYGQNGQYNYVRCAKRREWAAAFLAKADAMRFAMQTVFLIAGVYAPHDKWMHHAMKNICPDLYQRIGKLVETDLQDVEGNSRILEEIDRILISMLRQQFYVTSEGDFLPDLAVEIARRGQFMLLSEEELIRSVCEMRKTQDSLKPWLSDLCKSLLAQYRYDLEQGNEYLLTGDAVPEQRRQIVETILNIVSEEKPEAYVYALKQEIEYFSDAMLVQYGRYLASQR